MRRFFVEPQAISANQATLSPAESRHLTTVLRLQPGDGVELFDGTGAVYQGEIQSACADRITVAIHSRFLEDSYQKLPQLIFFQSLLKGKKMDFLVQKATELGVHTFCPVNSRYSENRGNPARQIERWQRIMLEACKQCKRAYPMQIAAVSPLDRLDLSSFTNPLLLWEREGTQGLNAAITEHNGPIALLTGPEGGFSEDEIKLLRKQGCIPVSLGPLILRAETAALSAIAVLQYLGGALSPRP